MNVYIDSNFVLEITLEQEQFAAASNIHMLAQMGRIQLVCPTLCIAEPLARLTQRRQERRVLRDDLKEHAKQLSRTGSHHEDVQKMEGVQDFLKNLDDLEAAKMRQFLISLLRHCRVLAIDEQVLSHTWLIQEDYDLEIQDALIAASVLIDLDRQGAPGSHSESIFVSRDSRAFAALKERLKPYNCSYIAKFTDAFSRINAKLTRPENPKPS